MQFTSVAVCIASLALTARATLPKAEFNAQTDCQGKVTEKHKSTNLKALGVPGDAHGVYLAPGTGSKGWVAYTGPISGAAIGQETTTAYCTGEAIGVLPNPCANLDDFKGKRVQCIYDKFDVVTVGGGPSAWKEKRFDA